MCASYWKSHANFKPDKIIFYQNGYLSKQRMYFEKRGRFLIKAKTKLKSDRLPHKSVELTCMFLSDQF